MHLPERRPNLAMEQQGSAHHPRDQGLGQRGQRLAGDVVDAFAFVHPQGNASQGNPAVSCQLEEAALTSRQSVGSPGVFLEKASRRSTRQDTASVTLSPHRRSSSSGSGVGSAKGLPGTSRRQLMLSLTDRLARFQEGREFRGRTAIGDVQEASLLAAGVRACSSKTSLMCRATSVANSARSGRIFCVSRHQR